MPHCGTMILLAQGCEEASGAREEEYGKSSGSLEPHQAGGHAFIVIRLPALSEDRSSR